MPTRTRKDAAPAPTPATVPLLRIYRGPKGPRAKPKPAAPPKFTPRPCLGPGAIDNPHDMPSRSEGNRVCPKCRQMQLGLRLSVRDEAVCVRAPGGVSLPPE